jgi:methylglutaconyl-CoA hydratase
MDILNEGDVSLDIRDGQAIVTFQHPAHNSLPSRLLAKLVERIQQADADAHSSVIILQSLGERTFCAGASFDELASIEDFDAGKRFFLGFANVINACRKCTKLILGRVQGKAVGGGVGLAAAVDYCFATTNASIKLSELAVGIGPFVVGPIVERKIGLSAMSQMAVNATEWHTAAWARDKGLYTTTFETVEEMDDAMSRLSKKLCASSTEAQRALKQIFWQGTEHWDELLDQRAAISGRLVLTEAAKDAIHKFKNKR